MAPALPLSDAELEELDALLISDAAGEDSMDVAMLDGFLTALAIGPHDVPADEWLPLVWGKPVRWPSPAVAERMTALVLRHAEHLAAHLRSEPDLFEPMFLEREIEGETLPILDEWCMGFMKGIELDAAAWQFFLETEEGAELLRPLRLYGTQAGWDELAADPELEALHPEHAAAIGAHVIAILHWWQPVRQRAAAATPLAEEADHGICPCSSGKAFSACCGRERTLH
jgi:uncharacterized protein